jgi:hypothetical protein
MEIMKFNNHIFVMAIVSLLLSCSDRGVENGPAIITDAQLLSLAQAPGGWMYYRNSTDTLVKASNSAHDEPRLRTRYNAKAATQLDVNGKVRLGANFPDSSLIVKELFTGPTITTLAIMLKLRSAPNAGNDWIWSELDVNGNVKISAASKGAGCVSCHSAGLDYTRMNDAHP